MSDPGPDYADADGPYYYDGGGYYDQPRPVDVTVEQRAYYARPYYGPPVYPGYYGGYHRFYGRPDRDYRHDGRDNHDGPDRERSRGDRGDNGHSRAVPNRPSEFHSHDAPTRSSGSSSRSGGPHGGRR